MSSKSYLIALLLVFALAAVSPASATAINTYSDYASWAAATAGLTTIDFSTTALGTYGYNALSLQGVQFNPVTYSSFTVADPDLSWWSDFGGGNAIQVYSAISPEAILLINLPTAVTSLGINLATWNNNGVPGQFSITINGGTPQIVSTFEGPSGPTQPPGQFGFFGTTFDSSISTVQITALGPAGIENIIDDISFGTYNPVDQSPMPEGTSLLMIGSGLVGMRIMSKKVHLFGV